MKKLLLVFILLFNLVPSYRNGTVCFHSVEQVSAQSIPCGNQYDSFWAWLKRVLDGIAEAVTSIVVQITTFFDQFGGGGENYNGNNLSWSMGGSSGTFYFNYDPTLLTQSQINIINYLGGYYNQFLSSGAAGPQYYLTLNNGPERYYNYDNIYIPVENTDGINLRLHYDSPVTIDPNAPMDYVYDENDPLPTNDYDWYNGLSSTVYAHGVTATYPKTPRTLTTVTIKQGGTDPVIGVNIKVYGSPPTDTVKPTKVNCDTLAVTRAVTATQMLDSLDKSPQMKQLRDSALGSHEVALSGYDSSGTTRYFPGSFYIGGFDSVIQITRDSITGPNHKNVNSLVHLHEKNIDPNVDCADLYTLLHGRLAGVKNRFLNHSFVIGGDTLIDLVVVVYDTTKALNFINVYQRNSAVVFDSTGPIWSQTYRGASQAYPLSLGREFDRAVDLLRKNHYPENMIQTYAQVYMMEHYDMGIKMLISTGSGASRTLRELSPIITSNAVGKLKNLKIKICP